MKVSIAVHGRFHAFDLGAALLSAGHDVHLFTNARPSAVASVFPLDRARLFRRHFVISQAARRLAGGEPPPAVEARLKQMFGRWAAKQHIAQQFDVIHCWSGVAEESLRACAGRSVLTVARGSAHIRAQHTLLAAEQRRTGRSLELPSSWIIAREEREYELAEAIVVPSEFARRTFIDEGVPAGRVRVLPLATRATGFNAAPADVEARVERIRLGRPLRVLYVGMLSYRKGMHDLLDVMKTLGRKLEFRLVGPLLPECREFAQQAAQWATVEPAVPQSQLPAIYAWGDVFVLPTIEDGFAVVLAQAQAAGLPIITTTNSGGPDILADGGQGFTVAIRDAQAITERLLWCDDNRDELANMVESLHVRPPRRSWDDVAADFEQAVTV